jgi:hypothetical protein
MKKTLAVCMAAVVMLAVASNAYSWGSATHAVGANHSGITMPGMNLNEIYGVMAADLFTYSFELGADYLGYCGWRADRGNGKTFLSQIEAAEARTAEEI